MCSHYAPRSTYSKMNGSPLIFIVICIIKAIKCIDEHNSNNKTELEQQNDTTEDEYYRERLLTSTTPRKLFPESECPCPCKGTPRVPVCGKTTSGLIKTFDSQCHLICHNQCELSERYAIIFHGDCPLTTAANRKNVYSNWVEIRRTDFISGEPYKIRKPELTFNSYPASVATSSGIPYIQSLKSNSYTSTTTSNLNPYEYRIMELYESLVTPHTDNCECNYCPLTKWIRVDYYTICAEKDGQKRTFDSWCHFDCENKCVKRTGGSYLYLHKGECMFENQPEMAVPRTFNTVKMEQCIFCISLCKPFFEPVCARNSKKEYLSFISRCHMRCHNQCLYSGTDEGYIFVSEGHCSWL